MGWCACPGLAACSSSMKVTTCARHLAAAQPMGALRSTSADHSAPLSLLFPFLLFPPSDTPRANPIASIPRLCNYPVPDGLLCLSKTSGLLNTSASYFLTVQQVLSLLLYSVQAPAEASCNREAPHNPMKVSMAGTNRARHLALPVYPICCSSRCWSPRQTPWFLLPTICAHITTPFCYLMLCKLDTPSDNQALQQHWQSSQQTTAEPRGAVSFF